MNKFLSIIISLTMMLAILSACKNNGSTSDTDSTDNSTGNTEESQSMTDKSTTGADQTSSGDITTTPEETTGQVVTPTLTEQLHSIINTAMNTVPKVTYVPQMDPKNVGNSNIVAIYYTGMGYQNMDSTRVFAYIGFPEGASAQNPVPAVVCVHGGGGQAFFDWVKKWTDKGYAAIAMDTYGKHPAGANGAFVKDNLGGPDIDYMRSGNSKIESQWMTHAVTQAILAANLMRADTRVAGDKIGITGISWGGHITANAISHDNRFAFAVPVYGCAFLPGTAGAFADNFKNPNASLLWDPSERLKSSTVKTLWFNGDMDKHFAVNATQKSYEATKSGEILIHHAYNHSQNSGMNPNEIYVFADSVVRQGAGLALPSAQPTGGGNVSFSVNMPDKASNILVTAYYLTTDITYNSNYQFTGTWKTVNGTYSGGKVSVTIPNDATMYYVSISYKHNTLSLKSSSGLVVLK